MDSIRCDRLDNELPIQMHQNVGKTHSYSGDIRIANAVNERTDAWTCLYKQGDIVVPPVALNSVKETLPVGKSTGVVSSRASRRESGRRRKILSVCTRKKADHEEGEYSEHG